MITRTNLTKGGKRFTTFAKPNRKHLSLSLSHPLSTPKNCDLLPPEWQVTSNHPALAEIPRIPNLLFRNKTKQTKLKLTFRCLLPTSANPAQTTSPRESHPSSFLPSFPE